MFGQKVIAKSLKGLMLDKLVLLQNEGRSLNLKLGHLGQESLVLLHSWLEQLGDLQDHGLSLRNLLQPVLAGEDSLDVCHG